MSWPSRVFLPPPESPPTSTKIIQCELFDSSEVKGKSVAWRWSLTTWVVQFIDAKYISRAVLGRVTCQTHSVTHTQRRQTVTVVVIKEKGRNAILISIHERILSCFGLGSFRNQGIPRFTVDDFSSRCFQMIVKSLPHGMGSWVRRVKLPLINSSFRVNGKQFSRLQPKREVAGNSTDRLLYKYHRRSSVRRLHLMARFVPETTTRNVATTMCQRRRSITQKQRPPFGCL